MPRGGIDFRGIGIRQASFKAGTGLKSLATTNGRDSVVGLSVIATGNGQVDIGTNGKVPFGVVDIYENDGTVGVTFRGFVADVITDGDVVAGRKCLIDSNGLAKADTTNAGTEQSVTRSVTTAASVAGDLEVTVIAKGHPALADGKTIIVELDTTSANANAKDIRDALADDADISAFFTVAGTNAAVILTAKKPSANDTTMELDYDATDVGNFAMGTATDVAGVADTKVEPPIFIEVDNENEVATVFFG